jgi:hypothetical protein
MVSPVHPVTTLIVRVTRDPAARIHVLIERASSGAKRQVNTLDAIGPAIAEMLQDETGPMPIVFPGSVVPKQEPKS